MTVQFDGWAHGGAAEDAEPIPSPYPRPGEFPGPDDPEE